MISCHWQLWLAVVLWMKSAKTITTRRFCRFYLFDGNITLGHRKVFIKNQRYYTICFIVYDIRLFVLFYFTTLNIRLIKLLVFNLIDLVSLLMISNKFFNLYIYWLVITQTTFLPQFITYLFLISCHLIFSCQPANYKNAAINTFVFWAFNLFLHASWIISQLLLLIDILLCQSCSREIVKTIYC